MRIQALVGLINQQDEIDRAALERVRDRLAGDLAGMTRGRSALDAYGRESGEGTGGPRYQDREA